MSQIDPAPAHPTTRAPDAATRESQRSNFTLRSLVSFVLVGGFATAVQYGLMFVVLHYFAWSTVPASAFGYAVSALANYLLNARLTFHSQRIHAASAPRFIVTASTGLLLNSLLLSIFLGLGLGAVLAQLLTTLGVLVWNYSINGLWTFRKPNP